MCVRARAEGYALFDRHTTFEGHQIGEWLRDIRRGLVVLTPERDAQLRAAGIYL